MAVKLDKTATVRDAVARKIDIAPGRQLYVLDTNGALDRYEEPDWTLGDETEAQGYSDEGLTVPVSQPFNANSSGQYDVWFALGSYDLYAPNDATHKITRWQPIAGAVPAEVATLSDEVAALDATVGTFDGRIDDLEGSASAPAIAAQDLWTVGREWSTRFDNASMDAALFDSINFTRTTDGGRTCLTQTAAANPSLFTLKAQQAVENVDVLIRYRYVSDGTYGLDYINIFALARWVSPASGTAIADYLSNCMYGADNRTSYIPSSGVAQLAVGSAVASVEGAPAAQRSITPPLNGTETTKHRYLRFRVIGDVLYIRNWFADVNEPDAWNIVVRSRPATYGIPAAQAVELSADDIPMGSAGFYAQLTATYFYELTIRELVPRTTSGVDNATFTEELSGGAAATGAPRDWYHPVTHANATVSRASIADRNGLSRPALRLVVASPGTSVGALWQQRIWNSLKPGGNAAWPRLRPYPRMAFAPFMEVRVWSKGTAIENDAPTVGLFDDLGLAACIDNYYYDRLGVAANAGTPDYFWYLGPNVGGTGTWDWYETVFVMPIRRHQDIAYLDLAFGIHDAGAHGKLEIMDPVFRAVS